MSVPYKVRTLYQD